MMHTKGKFKVLESDFYTAVALPLDTEYINVRNLLDLCLSICPVKIFFDLDKIRFVNDKIRFVNDKIFFVHDKSFVHSLK